MATEILLPIRIWDKGIRGFVVKLKLLFKRSATCYYGEESIELKYKVMNGNIYVLKIIDENQIGLGSEGFIA